MHERERESSMQGRGSFHSWVVFLNAYRGFFFFFLTFCKLWLSLDLITMKLILGTIIRFLERKRKSRRQVSAMILRPKQLFIQSKGGDTFLSISMLVFILASNLQPYYMIKAFGFILVPPHAHVSIWNTSRKCGLQLPSKKKKCGLQLFILEKYKK